MDCDQQHRTRSLKSGPSQPGREPDSAASEDHLWSDDHQCQRYQYAWQGTILVKINVQLYDLYHMWKFKTFMWHIGHNMRNLYGLMAVSCRLLSSSAAAIHVVCRPYPSSSSSSIMIIHRRRPTSSFLSSAVLVVRCPYPSSSNVVLIVRHRDHPSSLSLSSAVLVVRRPHRLLSLSVVIIHPRRLLSSSSSSQSQVARAGHLSGVLEPLKTHQEQAILRWKLTPSLVTCFR